MVNVLGKASYSGAFRSKENKHLSLPRQVEADFDPRHRHRAGDY